jgi:transcriptional regulator with XRE-family HTH domain
VNLKALTTKARIRRELPPPAVRRAIREAAGVSQADIAAALGVDRVTVTRYESGARTPRGERLAAYVRVLRELGQIPDVVDAEPIPEGATG